MLSNWVAQSLQKSGLRQADLSRLLTEKLGRSIDRAAVNKMVKDERRIGADEMLAIAELTGQPIPGYDVIHVPVVSWVSAGLLADASTQVPAAQFKTIPVLDLGDGDFFALEVHGDSMDRLSPDGSLIIVNRRDTRLQPGKPYVFSVRGEATYKLWRPSPARLSPYSTNPINEPIFVEDEEDLEVVGRVRRTLLDL